MVIRRCTAPGSLGHKIALRGSFFSPKTSAGSVALGGDATEGDLGHHARRAAGHVRQDGGISVWVTIDQAAFGGICLGSASIVGGSSSVIGSTCM